MKRDIVLVLLTAIAIFALGATALDGSRIGAIFQADPSSPWQLLGTITASNATLAVTARDRASVEALPDANTVTWNLPNDARMIEVCYAVKSNNESDVVECWVTPSRYLSNGVTGSPYTLGFIDTLTGGLQTGLNTNVFVDTIATTDYRIGSSVIFDSATDRLCVHRFDPGAQKKLVWIATTLTGSSCIYIYGRYLP